jgi:hypothetical protein
MDEISLPQHVARRIERRWSARLWQMANLWQRKFVKIARRRM